MRSPVIASFATASLALLTSVAAAGEPRGPEIGNVRYTASIDFHGTVADTDDYVVTLAAGDKLAVTVAATAKSALLPTLVLVDPQGAVVDPAAKVKAHGRQLVVGAFTATATGKWAVRVGSSDSTEGGYTAKFHVTPAKASKFVKYHLGGADPTTTSYPFEAVAGSKLTLTLRSAGKTNAATIRAVTGPDAAEVPGWRDVLVVKGAVSVLKNLPLGSASGTFHVEVGVDTGEATCSATLAVTPPDRPKGSVAFGDEPWLNAASPPVDGIAGQVAQFTGSHISVFLPHPKVWIDDKPASVLSVAAGGGSITVVVPPAPGDTIAAVTVQNPDGQATTRSAAFHYVPQGPLDVESIEPAYARIAQGTSQTFKVTLTRVPAPPGIDVVLGTTADLGTLPPIVHIPGNTATASFALQAGQTLASGEVQATYATTISADVGVVPPGTVSAVVPDSITLVENAQQTFTVQLSSAAPTVGADVALLIPSAVGTGPGSVHVAGGKTSATFVLTAAARRGAGSIKATLGGNALASVNVNAPTSLDISGWTVTQQYSSKTYTFPQGTVLQVSDCVVIGKNATQSQFVTAWNTVFSNQVHYMTGADFPDIDGYETMTLKDKSGNVVDGPTIQMAQNGGFIYGRTAGQPAGQYTSWLAYNLNGSQGGLPGTGEQPAPTYPGIYISKFSDSPSGSYDFVEIYLDLLP
jgi:hypothetical protein